MLFTGERTVEVIQRTLLALPHVEEAARNHALIHVLLCSLHCLKNGQSSSELSSDG